MKLLPIIFAAFFMITFAAAVEPDEVLDDPVLEERAKEIDNQLRCVVCQSQSIAESNAPLAKDLRILVRERLTEGDSNTEAINYIVDRYGDYVLMKPPFQANTFFLWLFPALAFLGAGVGAFAFLRRAKTVPIKNDPLSDDDEEAVQRIIDERG